jgi:hypothetical protein
LAALWVSWVAAFEGWNIYRLRNQVNPFQAEFYTAGIVICAIEGCLNVYGAIVLACGQWGNTLLPARFHAVYTLGFFGLSIFPTYVLVAIFREQLRQRYNPQRSLWLYYRIRFILFALFSVSIELGLAIILPTFGDRGWENMVAAATLFSVYFLLGVSFIYHAYKFAAPVLRYLKERKASGVNFQTIPTQTKQFQNIARLTICLGVNGLVIVFCLALQLVISILFFTRNLDPTMYLILAVVFGCCRFGSSLCHIRSVKPRRSDGDQITFSPYSPFIGLSRLFYSTKIVPFYDVGIGEISFFRTSRAVLRMGWRRQRGL